ncbi:MAG TPA: glycosyltransferase family 2 protein [Dehalococcoidia bacterium]|nr:glycosyltransferase family 2 protein [Dehalococcoidia bacterium]
MAGSPLVSITIPSRNSEATIALCLEGAVRQSYPNLEVLLIDSHSTDKTKEVAAHYKARVIDCDGRLLAARCLGVRESLGDYIVLVDTDLILEATAIERAVNMMDKYDMLILEEHSYNTNGFIPKLYSASKQIINSKLYWSFDPIKRIGNPPRFFKRELLEKAIAAIPQDLIPITVHYDHDIIYLESYKISQRVGILPNAAFHIEPDWEKLWRTNFRYGASLRELKKSGYYRELATKRGTGLSFGRPLRVGFQSLLLSLLLQSVQRIGYWFGSA